MTYWPIRINSIIDTAPSLANLSASSFPAIPKIKRLLRSLNENTELFKSEQNAVKNF